MAGLFKLSQELATEFHLHGADRKRHRLAQVFQKPFGIDIMHRQFIGIIPSDTMKLRPYFLPQGLIIGVHTRRIITPFRVNRPSYLLLRIHCARPWPQPYGWYQREYVETLGAWRSCTTGSSPGSSQCCRKRTTNSSQSLGRVSVLSMLFRLFYQFSIGLAQFRGSDR